MHSPFLKSSTNKPRERVKPKFPNLFFKLGPGLIVGLSLVAGVVLAVTTIGTDIDTEGNLTVAGNISVTGTSTLSVDGNATFGTVQASHLLETKTDDYIVLTTDKGKALVMNSSSDKTFSLPSVDATNAGTWYIFVKIGTGKVTIDAADSDVINDSTAGGGIYDAQTNETYAVIIVELVSETQWVAYGGVGTWTTN